MPRCGGADPKALVWNSSSSQNLSRRGWAGSSSSWKRPLLRASVSAVCISQPPSVFSPRMELSSLTPEQLKQLVHGLVDDRLRELIGDPDLGLELGEVLR